MSDELAERERATRILPFGRKITVAESTVTEEERPSGLVLPHAYDGAPSWKRGVILAVPDDLDAPLEAGQVVYYFQGTRLAEGVIVVDLSHVLAYEP